eukprot:2839541-Lingulodinium_polyedra.AAC.1
MGLLAAGRLLHRACRVACGAPTEAQEREAKERDDARALAFAKAAATAHEATPAARQVRVNLVINQVSEETRPLLAQA